MSFRIRPVDMKGFGACLLAEIVAGCIGFLATVHLARRLEPRGFASLEMALAAGGWMLVLVRGGLDQIVVREAARHPRLIGRLTRLLIGLRLVWAVVGFAIIAALAVIFGWERGPILLAAGMIVFPSAWVADVGPRARNELNFLAGMQVVRAIGLIVAAFGLVSRPGDILVAAIGPALAELLVALACLGRYPQVWAVASSRCVKRRAAIVFSRRAVVAGMTRFGRVGLYAADALALGLTAWAGQGEYAVARRVLFALIAVGVVVPSLLAPSLARAKGRNATSAELGRGLTLLLSLFIPAAIGMILVGDRGLPFLFGPNYVAGVVVLSLIALRLPALLVATWFQVALVAIGQEAKALRLITVMGIATAIALPISASAWGVTGVAATILGVEALAVFAGWSELKRLGLAPALGLEPWPIFVGNLAMVVAVVTTKTAPVPVSVGVGLFVYGSAWLATRSLRPLAPLTLRRQRVLLRGQTR